ncbi:MAG: DoxX family membrane protein [Marinobacter sp.]|uniref:DoxX family protein n=1 Tax=Marinobacter sp. TaxID=50741 RepID=UPI003296E476
MIFFLCLLVLTGAALLLGSFGVAYLRQGRTCMRLALAIAMVIFGVDHLLTPERYLAMIDSWLPSANALVAVTGYCEIAGGIGLLIPGLQRWAGLLLAAYFVAVFPANVHNALYGLDAQGLPSTQWYYWVRLLFQPLAVWWALYCTGFIRWPFRRARPEIVGHENKAPAG